MRNINVWKNEWYFVGFEEKPYLKNIEGIYTWVADEEIETSAEETGVFFLHFNSTGYEIDGELLQRDGKNFISSLDRCFTLDSEGNVVKFNEEDHIIEELRGL